MSKEVSSEVVVKLSVVEAWKKLQDLSLAHNYVPGLVKTEITTEQKQGVGASRMVYQTETKGIDETVIEWEEGQGFLIRLHRGEKGAPPPFKDAFFRYQILPGADENTAVLKNTMRYTMGMGFFGDLLEKLMLKNIFKGVIRDVTISQKIFYETGEKVTPERLKQAKADFKAASK